MSEANLWGNIMGTGGGGIIRVRKTEFRFSSVTKRKKPAKITAMPASKTIVPKFLVVVFILSVF